jgi:hypothetical protein
MTKRAFPLGIGTMSPDHPRSAVPAAYNIASIIIFTSIFIVRSTVKEVASKTHAERAHTYPKTTPTYGQPIDNHTYFKAI